jgi:hypothetical protein
MKIGSKVQLALALVVGIAVSSCCYAIYSGFPNRWNLLTWDPAAHGWEGMRLALDIKHFAQLQFLKDLNRLVLWPPLYAIFAIPYYLLHGFQYPSTVLCSLTFLALFFPALTWLYRQLETDWPGWIVLMVTAATSPFLLGFSTMPMLEIAGATLTCFSAGLFLKKSKWFPLSLTLLFFLKYNYCIYLLLPVLAMSFTKEARNQVQNFARQNRPAMIILVAFALFAATILVTGGTKIGSVSVHGIGNPAYVTFLLILAILIITRQYRGLVQAIRGTGWGWFVLPVLVWLLIPVPNRIKTIISFSINTSFGGPEPSSPAYYTYYFDQLPAYFSNYWLTWLFLAAGLVVAVLYRKRREVLFAALLFVIPFLLMSLNQNKQTRFLFTFIPALWILGAFAIDRLPGRILRYLVSAAICACVVMSFSADTVRENIKLQFAGMRAQPILNFIARRIEDAAEVRVLGTTNELNPSSIAYHTAELNGFRTQTHFAWELEKDPPRNVQIICINCQIAAKLARERTFPDGITVRHYFLDTSEAASYNPSQ